MCDVSVVFFLVLALRCVLVLRSHVSSGEESCFVISFFCDVACWSMSISMLSRVVVSFAINVPGDVMFLQCSDMLCEDWVI